MVAVRANAGKASGVECTEGAEGTEVRGSDGGSEEGGARMLCGDTVAPRQSRRAREAYGTAQRRTNAGNSCIGGGVRAPSGQSVIHEGQKRQKKKGGSQDGKKEKEHEDANMRREEGRREKSDV